MTTLRERALTDPVWTGSSGAQAKAKLSEVRTLTEEDIDSPSLDQIEALKGY